MIENIKIVRYYKSNEKPFKFYVQTENDYTFESCDTLEEAKKAIEKYKNGSFKDRNFYILEML